MPYLIDRNQWSSFNETKKVFHSCMIYLSSLKFKFELGSHLRNSEVRDQTDFGFPADAPKKNVG